MVAHWVEVLAGSLVGAQAGLLEVVPAALWVVQLVELLARVIRAAMKVEMTASAIVPRRRQAGRRAAARDGDGTGRSCGCC